MAQSPSWGMVVFPSGEISLGCPRCTWQTKQSHKTVKCQCVSCGVEVFGIIEEGNSKAFTSSKTFRRVVVDSQGWSKFGKGKLECLACSEKKEMSDE